MANINVLMSKIKSIKTTEKDRIIEEKDKEIEKINKKYMELRNKKGVDYLEQTILAQAHEIRSLKEELEKCNPLSSETVASLLGFVLAGIVVVALLLFAK